MGQIVSQRFLLLFAMAFNVNQSNVGTTIGKYFVVYFDQLLGVHSTQMLVKIHNKIYKLK